MIQRKDIEIMAPVGSYESLNAAIAAGAVIPSNLHLLFSAAPETKMENPLADICHLFPNWGIYLRRRLRYDSADPARNRGKTRLGLR